MLLKRIILVLPFLVLINLVYGQCPGPAMSVTPIVTPSICQSSGIIQLNTTGGSGPYTYDIDSVDFGAAPRDPRASNIFNVLPGGLYRYTVSDTCGNVVTDTLTLPSSYVIIDFTMTTSGASCLGNDGQIYVDATGGRGAYEYELVFPSPILDTVTIDTFSNLVPGNYRVKVTDSCGNFQTRDVTLSFTAYNLGTQNVAISADSVECDSVSVLIQFPASAVYQAPISYIIINTGTNDTIDTNVNIVKIPRGNYEFYVEDGCGNKTFSTTTLIDRQRQTPDITNKCYGGDVEIRHNSYYVKPIYEIITGPELRGPQDTAIFDSLPFGSYSYSICDTPCNVCDTGLFVIDSLVLDTMFMIAQAACGNGRGALQIFLNNPSDDSVTYTVINAPANSGLTLPYTVTHANSGSNNHIIENVPFGTYTVVAQDTCYLNDTITITASDTMHFDPSFSAAPSCFGNALLRAFGFYKSDADFLIYLRDSATDTLINSTIVPSGATYGPYDTDTLFQNLPQGAYVIEYTIFLPTCSGGYLRDTFFIDENYVQPTLKSIYAALCDPTSGFVDVEAQGGIPPYQYQLEQGPTIIRPFQSSSLFTSLPVGSYIVTASDSCGNSFQIGADVVSFDTLSITAPDTTCFNAPATISVDPIASASYSWTGPNGFTASTSLITIPSVTPSDTGVYSVRVILLVGVGDTCVDTILTARISTMGDADVDIAYSDSIICEDVTNPLPVLISVPGGIFTSTANIVVDSVTGEIDMALSDTGSHTIYYNTVGICPALDSAEVEIQGPGNGCSFFIPEFISPNGDGLNDVFEIPGLESYPNASLKVFNRWGKIVYRKQPYDNMWDGFNNADITVVNRDLPSGSYYIVLDLNEPDQDPHVGILQIHRKD